MDLAPHATTKQFSGDAEVRAKEIKKLHKDVHLKIEKQNAKYVEQANRRRKFVEFEVGDNAYKLELFDDYDISHIFNVKDLRLYHGEELRTSLFSKLWRIDAGAPTTTNGNLTSIMEYLDLEGCKAI